MAGDDTPGDKQLPDTGKKTLMGFVQQATSTFLEQATSEDLLKLAQLAKEAREMEHRAAAAKDAVAARKALAMRAMDLREHVIDTVVKARMDKSDKALDLLIDKLGQADDPATITAVADAIAKVAATDQLSDVGDVVAAIKADDVDLEF